MCLYVSSQKKVHLKFLTFQTKKFIQSTDFLACHPRYFTYLKSQQKSLPRNLEARQLIQELVRAQEMYRKLGTTREDRYLDSNWYDGLSMLISGINAASSRTMKIPNGNIFDH